MENPKLRFECWFLFLRIGIMTFSWSKIQERIKRVPPPWNNNFLQSLSLWTLYSARGEREKATGQAQDNSCLLQWWSHEGTAKDINGLWNCFFSTVTALNGCWMYGSKVKTICMSIGLNPNYLSWNDIHEFKLDTFFYQEKGTEK